MVFAQCGKKAGASVGRLDAARLIDVAGKEEASQPEGVVNISRIAAQARAALQEGRQRQHLVAPWQACLARHRATRFRRNIGQVLRRAGGGALAEIEAEAEFVQYQKLEARHQFACGVGIVEMDDHHGKRFIETFMRVALG